MHHLRVLSAALICALCLAVPRASHAYDGYAMMRAYSVTTSLFYEGGRGELSDWRGKGVTPTAMGFRYYERQGIITGTLSAIAIALAGGVAAASPKSVETWEDANYRYTRTTYRSAAEQAEMQAATAATASAAASSKNQSFDLEIYSRSLGGDASGYRVNGYYGFPMGAAMFETGFGWGTVTSSVWSGGRGAITRYHYIGMPVRLDVSFRYGMAFAEWQWNWLGHGDLPHSFTNGATVVSDSRPMPLKLGYAVSVLDRLHVEAAVLTPGITSAAFAYRATVGLNF